MGKLEKNILDTLVYYDVMDYPMTSFEIWKYLTTVSIRQPADQASIFDEKFSLLDVVRELEGENLQKFIEEHQGYFFLHGRKALVEGRIEKNKLANEKFKILRRAVWWLRFVPYVRMIAVTGSMAMKNTEQSSDLDLLVALKHGKIFTGRTLVTAMIHLLGKRRYANKVQNRICLNYFITTKSLEIVLKDIFSASEYSFIVPVFGFRFFRKFQESNAWIGKYKPNFSVDSNANLRALKDNSVARTMRRIGEKIFGFEQIEISLKKWQVERISFDPRTHQDGSMVVADSDMLIFLPDPQGPKIFEKFKACLERLL